MKIIANLLKCIILLPQGLFMLICYYKQKIIYLIYVHRIFGFLQWQINVRSPCAIYMCIIVSFADYMFKQHRRFYLSILSHRNRLMCIIVSRKAHKYTLLFCCLFGLNMKMIILPFMLKLEDCCCCCFFISSII